MKQQDKPPITHVTVHFSAKDHEKFMSLYKAAPEESITGYIRKRLFNEPVKIFYRDRAYDEFIEKATQLKDRLLSLALKADEAHQAWLREEMQTIKELLIKI